MPRGRLSEKHVQRVALDQLDSYYRSRVDVQDVVAEKEVVVRAGIKAGSGRADGLIASRLLNGTIYTAALEAKSSRTLLNISPWQDDERWVLHALTAGGLAIVPAMLVGWYVGSWLLTLVFSIVAFFGTGFSYLLLTQKHSRYRLIDVIQQVKRYPANEQWIALSADAYNLLVPHQETLRRHCRKEGIGLLQVNSKERVKYLETPRPRVPKGRIDFLEYYARSDVIRRKLRTKSEEDQNRIDSTGPLS